MAGVSTYFPTFECKLGEYFGYVHSIGEAYKLIEDFETKTTTRSSCFKADKNFEAVGE